MKKFLIPVLSIMLLLPFMYGGCLDSATDEILSQIPTVPSLAGTWGGPGRVYEANLPVQNGAQRLNADRAQFEACADTLPYVEVQIETDKIGNITDVTLCGESLSAWQGTIDGTILDGSVPDNYITYGFKTTTSEGADVYQGLLIFDVIGSNVYGFLGLHIWDGKGWVDLAEAMLQLNGGSLPTYAESDLYGSWSGFAIDFEKPLLAIGRTDPINMTFTQDTSFSISGNIEGATITNGYGNASAGTAGNFGQFSGYYELGAMEDYGNMRGYQSPDFQVIAGFAEPMSLMGGYSVFMLHK